MKRLRVIQVEVRPVVVVDDGEHLEPLSINPVVVKAADWPAYPTTLFAESLAELERSLNKEEDADGAVST